MAGRDRARAGEIVRSTLEIWTPAYLRQMSHADLERSLDLTISIFGTYALLAESHLLRMKRLLARRGRLAFAKDARLAADALDDAHHCFDRCEENLRLLSRLLDARAGVESKAWAEVRASIEDGR
jgi:hypothetical protein